MKLIFQEVQRALLVEELQMALLKHRGHIYTRDDNQPHSHTF
jgi:hypothetical protein